MSVPRLPAIVLLLCFVVGPVHAKSIKQSDFLNWDYAVWAWQNLKTGDAYDAEWKKVDAPYSEWRKLNKSSPQQALKALENNPNLELIKKGQALDLAYLWWVDRWKSNRTLFWQVFEPNCYEGGEMYGMLYKKSNYRFTDEWAQMNIFTGKCDWPDWRSAKGMAGDAQRKAEFMSNLKLYTKNGKH